MHGLPTPPLQEGAPQPAIIHETPMVRLWHRADPSFKVPKAALYIHLQLAGEPTARLPCCAVGRGARAGV